MKYAHIYIHHDSIGDHSRCKNILEEIRGRILELYQNGEIIGASAYIVTDEEKADEELISFFIKYKPITHNQFPFLYVSLQPPESPDEMEVLIDQIMADFGFTRHR